MKKILIIFLGLVLLFPFVSAADTTIQVLDCFTKEPIVNQEIKITPLSEEQIDISCSPAEACFEGTVTYFTDENGEAKITNLPSLFIFTSWFSHTVQSDVEGGVTPWTQAWSSEVIDTSKIKNYYKTCRPHNFQIQLNLKTDFFLLTSWARLLKAGTVGSYGRTSNCRVLREVGGWGLSKKLPLEIGYYSETFMYSDFDDSAYCSNPCADKNPECEFCRTKLRDEPAEDGIPDPVGDGECYAYAIEWLRGPGGIKKINFDSLSPTEVNKIDLTLDRSEESMRSFLMEFFTKNLLGSGASLFSEIEAKAIVDRIYGLFG